MDWMLHVRLMNNSHTTGTGSDSFTLNLEAAARRILDGRSQGDSRWSAASTLDDEIALALSQIDRLRAREREVMESLLEAECAIGTELLGMEARTPRYALWRWPEREKMQRRLQQLGSEQRRLRLALAERLDGLHVRLLSLVSRRRLLSLGKEDGY
jgi:hypothetical protein